jgi:ATP-dependent exoDNAse (exonuclease V) beta subunit
VKLALPVLDHAPWSPSKLDLAARCPKAFKFRYVDKIKTSTKGSAAKIGTTAHKAQELSIEGASTKEAFEQAIQQYSSELTNAEVEQVNSFAPAVDEFNSFLARFKSKYNVKAIYAEKEWAIDADFKACSYADKAAMIRGIVDLVIILDNGQAVIIDHKSGKKKPVESYATQLDTYAILALAHHPEIKAVQCAIHFMAHEKVEWYVLRRRDDIQSLLHPWLVGLLNKRTEGLRDYLPIVKRWTCGWCDFLKVCPEGNQQDGEREGGRSDEKGSVGAP